MLFTLPRRKKYKLDVNYDRKCVLQKWREIRSQSCPSPDSERPGSGGRVVHLRRQARMEAGGRGSVSSGGSEGEAPPPEHEDVVALTHDVRAFKEALGVLRRVLHPDRAGVGVRAGAHERLGEVLRILRGLLEKYPPIQSTELLVAAGALIQHVKGFNYEDEKSDPVQFFDAIDQLALAFSSRVSEYLMGDLDSSSQPVPKTRSCDNLLSADGECDPFVRDKRQVTTLPPDEIDARLARLHDGVDLALRRAKVWSKYAKDVMTYIEKRCCAEAEHAKNLVKLATTMKSILKEESFLPFQSIYSMALDQDFDNGHTSIRTCTVLQGHKFIEPLTARRNEHERYRKQIKETWHRELKRTHESITNLRKARALYFQRQQEYERAKESALRAEEGEIASKVDKKRRVEDEALQRAMEAETMYKSCVVEANERQTGLDKMKCEVLQQVRELIYQCDQTMKAVTVGYFQLQSTLSAHAPVQYQTLCESSRLYEPGTQYMEFVKRLPLPSTSNGRGIVPFAFEPYSSDNRLEKSRRSNGSNESSEDVLHHGLLESRLSADNRERRGPLKHAWGGASDSDSMSSSNKSQDTSPAASPHPCQRKLPHLSSGDELDENVDSFNQARRPCMSKAAETHSFRRLKTPSRCRECDSYVYFHGFECFECGLASHKKCLESLAIQCGRKRLPRKMTTFGVDLATHALETGDEIPYIVRKCIAEVEDKGMHMKGIYRVSGVKSKVEKLCQSFENGAELVDLDGVHPNVVSNVLKLYLRQLPEPLLTYRFYPEFIKIAKDYPAQKNEEVIPQGAVDDLRNLVQSLPRVHLSTISYLMHHLHRLSESSNSNNMPPSNLGIVFGPTLLRTSEGSASLSSLVDTVHQTRVIELLIGSTPYVFGPSARLSPSQKEEKNISKSVRYRPPKQSLSRTVSASSQVSDLDESHFTNNRRDGIPDLDDYPIPGYLPADKSQDSSHQNSDVTHSSEDLLYSGGVLSDDEFPEIVLPEDNVFKKASLTDGSKPNGEMLPECGQLLKPAIDPQTSVSTSPTISDCSSLLRSTDDDEPSRKPANLNLSQINHGQSLNQACLLDLRQGSESSGISSVASISPTSGPDTSSAPQSDIFTSSAMVTLADQKSPSRPSSVTAELRRQFFDLPPPTPPHTTKERFSLDEISESASGEEQCSKDVDLGMHCEGSGPRPRGSSLPHPPGTEQLHSEIVQMKVEKTNTNPDLSLSMQRDGICCSEPNVILPTIGCHTFRTIERLDSNGKKQTEILTMKHTVQKVPSRTFDSTDSGRKIIETVHFITSEGQTMEGAGRGIDKLSSNRQPRFV